MNITELKTALEALEARAQQYESRHQDILKRVETIAEAVPAIGAEIDSLTNEYVEISEEAERLQVTPSVTPVARLEEILSSIQYQEAHGDTHSAVEQRLLHEGEHFPERLEAAHAAALTQQQAD